jgi:hypothetical protein
MMLYRGRILDSRTFADATGEGDEYFERIDGQDVVRVREHRIRLRTSEEHANEAAAAAAAAKVEARLAKLRDVRQKIKAGTDTAADRSKAIRLLIGVVLGLAPEDDEA